MAELNTAVSKAGDAAAESDRPRLGRAGALFVVGGWLVLAGIKTVESALQAAATGQPIDYGYLLRMDGPIALVGMAATPFVLWTTFRFPLTLNRWRRHLPVLASAVLLIVLLMNAARNALWLLLGVLPDASAAFAGLTLLLGVFHIDLVNVLLIAGIGHMVLYVRDQQRRRVREVALQAQLAEARLRALQSQIQPHFLFNSLHTIAQLIRTDRGRESIQLVELLGTLLRRTLRQGQTPLVPLHEELDFARTWLEIEQVRFPDRLRVHWNIGSNGTTAALVPGLLLQPLIENAIRHGIARHSAAGRIEITVERADSTLRITVRDDGGGLAGRGGNGDGLGLRNTRERLRAAFGDKASLVLRDHPDGGAEAVVELPFEPVND